MHPTRVMCGWCHEMNNYGVPQCWNCGHRPGVSRMGCDCPHCSAYRLRYLEQLAEQHLQRQLGGDCCSGQAQPDNPPA